MTVSYSISIKIKEGKEEAYEEFIKSFLEGKTKVYPGCLFVNFGKDDGDSSHYRINGEWETEKHRQDYMKWTQEIGVMDQLREFFSEPPVQTTYTIVWGRHFHM